MTDASNAYSRINPDSPWRWVPVLVVIAFAALTAMDVMWPDSFDTWWWIIFPLAVLGLTTSYKVGSSDAASFAMQEARATGGVRVNSHPWLARTMVVLGALLCCVLIAGFFTDYVRPADRSVWQRIPQSPVFVVTAILLLSHGLYRPWDLKVVDRGSRSIVRGDPVIRFIARHAGLLAGRARRLIHV